MTLLNESKAIQKRICSTPFPDDLQGIADDAHVIIARQAFRISQLELPLTPHKAPQCDWQDRTHMRPDGTMYAPTIPQMVDQHEQAILRDKLAVWLTRATFWFSVVGMTLFIGSLIYRATVGVY